MDMDLRPPTRPQQPMPSAAPAPVQPAQDPFKPDAPVTSGKIKKRGGKGKKFLMVLLVLILLGGVGYGVYYWQHQQVDKLAKENQVLTAQVAANNAKISELEAASKEAAVAEAPTADEQVIAVVTNRCVAGVDETTKKPLVYTQGTAGTENKKVLYSTDKTFAYINSSCSTTAANAAGTARATYLKLVNNEWVFLYSGQATDPIATKLYAIPAQTDFK